jgi:dethiobiotin synthetase
MKHIFITGTDTGIGKTIASAWLCTHWQADYWKPIQSGLVDTTDSECIRTLTPSQVHPEQHRLQAPLSPHLAADLEGIKIQLHDFHIPAHSGKLVIEGAGGCLVPINWRHTMIDLIQHLGTCTLLIARSGLGTINHTTLSLQALKAAQIPVLGVIMVGEPNPHNREAIEHFGEVPVLAELPHFEEISAEALANLPMPNRLLNALESL